MQAVLVEVCVEGHAGILIAELQIIIACNCLLGFALVSCGVVFVGPLHACLRSCVHAFAVRLCARAIG